MLGIRITTPKNISFWQQLRNANEELKDNQRFLVLPDKVQWGGVTELGSSMMVRDCYERIFNIMDVDWAESPSHYLLLGTPGIGKSFFLYYVCYKLIIKLKSTIKKFKIVVQTGAEGNLYFCVSAGKLMRGSIVVREINESEVLHFTSKQKNFYLIDSSLPHGVPNARTLMVTYPDPRMYDYYERHAVVKKLFMPTWSIDEARFARKHIFTRCDEQIFYANYEKIGGVVRNLLFKPHHLPVDEQVVSDDYLKECVTLALTSRKNFVTSLLDDTIYEPNEIIHYQVPRTDPTFRHHYVKLASFHVTQLLVHVLTDKQVVELGRMLKNINYSHPFASEKLEYFIIAVLLGLVSSLPPFFKIKYMKGSKQYCDVRSIHFSKLDYVDCGFAYLVDLDDIEKIETLRKKKGYKSIWGISATPQSSGIDGVYLNEHRIDLFHMKPRLDRKIKAGSIKEIIASFSDDARKIWLHQLLLDEHFDDARHVDYEGHPEEIAYIDDRVPQFALGLSLAMVERQTSIDRAASVRS